MSEIFGRACSVTVQAPWEFGALNGELTNALKVEGLRCTFAVTKTLKKEPNTLDLKVYNYSSRSRAQMQKKGAQVVVEAGYVGETAIIFSGDARTIDHVREGPDWITHIQCGDGEIATQFARINESFAPGKSIKDIGRVFIGKLTEYGLKPGNALKQLSNVSFDLPNGYSAHGRVVSEFDTFARSVGLEFSIQDGEIQLLPTEKVRTLNVPLITPNTGLIGSPDHGSPEKKGKPSLLKVKCLLRPTLKPGDPISVESDSTPRGVFKIMTLRHNGDTFGGDWYTELELLPVPNASIV